VSGTSQSASKRLWKARGAKKIPRKNDDWMMRMAHKLDWAVEPSRWSMLEKVKNVSLS